MLFQVTFALAASHHCDLVGPGAAILALQLNAFGAGLVINAAPVLAAPSAPRLFTISSYPVGEHLGSEALSCTHQLFNGIDAGALAVRDVLRGAQFSAAHWTWIGSIPRRALGPPASTARAIQSRFIRGFFSGILRHVGIHNLRSVVLYSSTGLHQKAQQKQEVA